MNPKQTSNSGVLARVIAEVKFMRGMHSRDGILGTTQYLQSLPKLQKLLIAFYSIA